MLAEYVKKKVIRSFDRSAGEYSRHAGFQWEIAQETARLALPHIRPGFRALDIGCGAGALMAHLSSPAAKLSRAIALDASGAMCKMAAQRLFPLGAGVIRAQAEALPFSAGSFDVIVSNLAMQWVADTGALFAEAGRVLRPGGVLIAATLGPGTFPELKRAAALAMAGKRAHCQLAAESFASMERLQNGLSAAGFNPRIDRAFRPRRYNGFMDFLHSLKKVGAMGPCALSGAGLARRDFLRRVEREYSSPSSSQEGFIATYEVFFISARLRG